MYFLAFYLCVIACDAFQMPSPFFQKGIQCGLEMQRGDGDLEYPEPNPPTGWSPPTSLDSLLIREVLYTSTVQEVQKQFMEEQILFFLPGGNGYLETSIMYGLFGYFVMSNILFSKKIKKVNSINKYHTARKWIRYILFICAFISAKNVENAI